MKQTIVWIMVFMISVVSITACSGSSNNGDAANVDLNYNIQSMYEDRVDFGQKFEPVGNRIIHGAGQSESSGFQSFDQYWDVIGPNKPLMTMGYVATHHPYYDYTEMLIAHLEKYPDTWLLPQIGLLFNKEENPETSYDQAIADGEMDDDLEMLLLNLKRINRPVYLRVGFEFNGEWNGYKPESYKLAVRHTKELINKLEIANIALVWCYTPAAKDIRYEEYYPGDDVIDWWAIDIFSKEDLTRPNTAAFLQSAEEHKKPVMIGEATPYQVGSVDNEAWEKWFEPFYAFIRQYSVIKSVNYINWDWTKYPQWEHWKDARLELNEDLTTKVQEELADPVWLHGESQEDTQMLLYP